MRNVRRDEPLTRLGREGEMGERGEEAAPGRSETIEGYVVDVACLRKSPRDELGARAARHTRACALMGHCIESGYGLVVEDGRVVLLDDDATRQVVDAVAAGPERGARLRVERRERDGAMRTVRVALV